MMSSHMPSRAGIWIVLLLVSLCACEDDCKDYLGPVRDASEIDECGAKMETVDGDIYWPDSERSSFEFSRLRHVRGSLVIDSSDRLESVSFPSLERVDGGVRIAGNSVLSAVSMPRLTHTGSLVLAADPALTTFSAEQLASLERSLVLRDVALSRLDLPALSGALSVGLTIESDLIDQVLLPKLREAEQVRIEAPNLRWVDLTRFERAFDFRVRGRQGVRDALGSLTLPSLQEVELLELSSLDALRTVSLASARRIRALLLSGNAQLESVLLPSDCALGSVSGSNNPKLCDFPALDARSLDPCDNPTYCSNNATQCF